MAVVIVAAITALGSVIVAVVARSTSKVSAQAASTTTENQQALDAWKELVGPLREELARERAEREQDRLDHVAALAAAEERRQHDVEEGRQVQAALLAHNEKLQDELRLAREQGGTNGG